MAGLSTLARLLKSGAFEEFEQGLESTRSSPVPTAVKGFTRGSLGATGARPLVPGASRNSDAAEDEERRVMQSPIMGAFLKETAGIR